MLPHPSKEFSCIRDGFGTSLVLSKPLIEKVIKKQKTLEKKLDKQVDIQSFPIPSGRKRVTLQGTLDKQAGVGVIFGD